MGKPVDPQISGVGGQVKPGLYRVRKPVGPPAFSSVQRVLDAMKAQPQKVWPACHGGALDPFAEGLMLVLVGPATKVFPFLHEIPKTYVATVKWGSETHNGDLLGTVTDRGDASQLTAERLDHALKGFLGWTEQVPPNTSNKRIDGERAWAKAARGEEFVLPPSKVFLHSAKWLSHSLPDSSVLELTCRGGYYVRSLARDLGRLLGCRAHLSALNRTQIGPWSCPEGDAMPFVGSEELLPWFPSRTISDAEAGSLNLGQALHDGAYEGPRWDIPHSFPQPPARVAARHLGKLKAILERRDHGWVATLQFKPVF